MPGFRVHGHICCLAFQTTHIWELIIELGIVKYVGVNGRKMLLDLASSMVVQFGIVIRIRLVLKRLLYWVGLKLLLGGFTE